MSSALDSASQFAPWEAFSEFVELGEHSNHPILGTPALSLHTGGATKHIELWISHSGDLPDLRPLREVTINSTVTADGERNLVLRTENPQLLHLFYQFSERLAERIQIEQVRPDHAIVVAVDEWRKLFEDRALLSDEKQIGLYGELWLLKRILASGTDAATALAAWTGPRGEAHDFRTQQFEIEVKTTRSERRSHIINSISQLEPSKNSDLYLLSIQVTSGGSAGTALSELVEETSMTFRQAGLAGAFETILKSEFNIDSENLHLYRERIILRTTPSLVRVDDDLPRLTIADLQGLSRWDAARVSDVRFTLNVDGLGFADGSAEFLKIIPEAQ